MYDCTRQQRLWNQLIDLAGDTEELVTALHEVGHTLMAHALGSTVHNITIDLSHDRGGGREHEDRAVVILAGLCLQDSLELKDEYQDAVTLVHSGIPWVERHVVETWCAEKVKALRSMMLRGAWRKCLLRLVPAVLEHRTLTGDEVRRLIGRHKLMPI